MRQRSQHRRRNRIIMAIVAALVTITTIAAAVIVYSNRPSPSIPTPTFQRHRRQQGIIQQSANIPEEKLKTGRVVTIGTFCSRYCPSSGDLKFWNSVIHKANGTYSATLKMQNLDWSGKDTGSTLPNDKLDLALGETKTSESLRCSITLVALVKIKRPPTDYLDYEEKQGLTLLITPYDDHRPIIQQNADASKIQAAQTSESRIQTAPLGGTLDFGSLQLDVPYDIGKSDGVPSIFLNDDGHGERAPLKLGKSQNNGNKYTLTFVGLADIGGKQGVTVMLTPPKHRPIIHKSATIVKEQLQKGTVQTGPLGEIMRFGNTELDLPYAAFGEGEWSGIQFDGRIRHDDNVDETDFASLYVGETQYLSQLHCSLTLVALTDVNSQQGATILLIPDSNHPIINKTAKMPKQQRRAGKIINQTFNDMSDGHFGENVEIGMPSAFRDIDGQYAIYIDAYDNQTPEKSEDGRGFLKLGETKTAKSLGCKITFVGLKEMDGEQGFTILITKL